MPARTKLFRRQPARRFRGYAGWVGHALIAATALAHNEAFITKNQRDFRFITDLNLLPYP